MSNKASQGGQPLLVTRGDRLSENDLAVSKSELLGTVTSILCGTSTNTPGVAPTFAGRILAMCSRYSEWPVRILLLLHTLLRKPCSDKGREKGWDGIPESNLSQGDAARWSHLGHLTSDAVSQKTARRGCQLCGPMIQSTDTVALVPPSTGH